MRDVDKSMVKRNMRIEYECSTEMLSPPEIASVQHRIDHTADTMVVHTESLSEDQRFIMQNSLNTIVLQLWVRTVCPGPQTRTTSTQTEFINETHVTRIAAASTAVRPDDRLHKIA